jgi:Flp pilus assembly protein TadG
VSAIIVALAMSVLFGSAALSVDYGHMVLERRNAQNAADAAARAVATDCVLKRSTCSTDATTRTTIVARNAGSTATSTGSKVGTSYTVDVAKPVDMAFAKLWGNSTNTVHAHAKATWGGFPVEGAPMLPMAIPYCTYKNNEPPATTPILLRSDVISVVFNVIVQGGTLGRAITTLLGELTGVTESCASSTGLNLKMIRGPIWMSGLEGTLHGTFVWNSSVCNMKTGTIDGFLGSTTSAVIPSSCVNKLGTMIKKGQVITLPIYEPSISLDKLGLELDGCLLGVCSAKIPPRIGVKVLGFAPFKITGWNYPNNVNLDPNAPPCAAINLLTHPPASVGCAGIQGYFVKSMMRDPDWTYSPNGVDLGASSVTMSE